MTPIEQHLKDYEHALLTLAKGMMDCKKPKYLVACEQELATARKKLADHITLCQTAHHHSQYELKTHGLP